MPFFKVQGICANWFVHILHPEWDDVEILRILQDKGNFLWWT